MEPQVLCIYHANCLDGFGAAYAVWKRLGEAGIAYMAADYGSAPPDVTGKQVIMVDFSYKRDVLLEMSEQADTILILDHHDTAERELVDLPDNVQVVFDQSKSGAVLAWEHYHTEAVPYMVELLQDRDLWRFNHAATRPFTARMFSVDQDFGVWDNLATDHKALRRVIDEGLLLEAKQQREVNALTEMKHVVWLQNFPMPDGTLVDVPAINCPWMFASDVGHRLNELFRQHPFSVTFMFGHDKVKFSLRSQGKIHCGDIAATFGGGGHPNAAGFTMSHNEFAYLLHE